MSSHVNSVVDYQKEKIRNEISSQVEEFLNKGGEIHVLGKQPVQAACERGSVWHSQNELRNFIEE